MVPSRLPAQLCNETHSQGCPWVFPLSLLDTATSLLHPAHPQAPVCLKSPFSHARIRPQHHLPEIRIPSRPFWVRECLPPPCPPTPGPYHFAVKLAFIAFTVHHSLLVLALARLDIPANPQGSWLGGGEYVHHTVFQVREGRPASRGQALLTQPRPRVRPPLPSAERGALRSEDAPQCHLMRGSNTVPHPSPAHSSWSSVPELVGNVGRSLRNRKNLLHTFSQSSYISTEVSFHLYFYHQ